MLQVAVLWDLCLWEKFTFYLFARFIFQKFRKIASHKYFDSMGRYYLSCETLMWCTLRRVFFFKKIKFFHHVYVSNCFSQFLARIHMKMELDRGQKATWLPYLEVVIFHSLLISAGYMMRLRLINFIATAERSQGDSVHLIQICKRHGLIYHM